MPNFEDSKSEAFLEMISGTYNKAQITLLDFVMEAWGMNGKHLTDLAHDVDSWNGLDYKQIRAVFHDMEILTAIHAKESKDNFEGVN